MKRVIIIAALTLCVSTTVEKGASSDGRKGGHAITMEG